MTALWIAAVVLIVIALAFMILPLARKSGAATGPARAEFDLTVYKDQLKEIERDQDRGVLSEDQAVAARTEIERRMLAAADEEAQHSGADAGETTAPKSTMGLVVAILIVVPLGAFGFYSYLGQPTLPDQPYAQRQLENRQTAQGNKVDMERARELLGQLEQRLKDNPDDVEGWLVLAQIYENMKRHADAAEVYGKVAALTDRHPEVLVAQVEAMIMAENAQVLPDAVALLKEIKEKSPSDPRSYFYLGLERRQKNDLQGAIAEYLALLKLSPANAEWVPQVKSLVEEMAGKLEIAVPTMETLPPETKTAGGAGEGGGVGPTQQQVQDAQQMSTEDRQAMIQSMVQRLADRLKDNPDDLEGWQRLANAYRVLGDQDGLAEAEAQIKRLTQ